MADELVITAANASFVLEQELGAIYLLEMTKCLTGIFGKGLP